MLCRMCQGDVVIRDGTVRIGDDVFKEHAITSVQLPDSLQQKIGHCAFQFCKELKEITFPEGLITIDGLAFAYCTQLENVVLPEGLKSLGDSAFRSCDSLTEITVPEGITFMSGTFATCYSLRTVNLPTWFNPHDERRCGNDVVHWKRYTCLLNSRTSAAKSGPSKLKTITTAFGSVRYVSEDGILYDTQDNSILFVNASITGNVTVRDGITTIGAGAFKGRKGLTSVTLPESCTVIDSYAFENCTALTDINFPEKLELIGRNAFYNSGITSLKLSQPGLHVGSFAFTDCHQLKSVEITSTDFDLMEWAFARCENLETVILPPQVFRMEGGCFTECTSLTTVVLPKNITFVHGFKDCTSLKTIEIPDSVTSIGYEAFANCKLLESIHLPDGVTNIGGLAFAQCYALKEINLPDSLTTIGEEGIPRSSDC